MTFRLDPYLLFRHVSARRKLLIAVWDQSVRIIKKKNSKTQLSSESIQDSESGKPTNGTSIKFRKLNYQIRPWRLPYKVINWAHSCLIDNLQHFALFYVACSQRVGFVSYQRQHKIYKEVFRRLKTENGWWWHCCFGCGQWLRYV